MKAPPVPQSTAAAEASTPTRQSLELVEAAQRQLQLGERLLEEQKGEEARLAFNRAVDLLLSVDGGVAEHPDVEAVYAQLIDHIHGIELKGYGAVTEVSPEQSLWQEELDAAMKVSDLAERQHEPMASSGPEPYDLPIEMNGKVAAIIDMYRDHRRDWFEEALRRSGRYLDYARTVFLQEELPQDLVYLGLVESAYKTRAVSRAGARGIWQFMPGTGRLYGLRQDTWIDERFDPFQSTRAAARHLKDLYEEFHDWYLVMAAYNAGANRVRRAVARAGTRDFWKLSRTRYLRRETKSYVPLILATILIAKDPARYGFDVSPEPALVYDTILLEAPMDLGTAAKCAGASLEEMKRLNPELRRWVTPLNRREYVLRIPQGAREQFCRALEELPPNQRVRFASHKVRRGDTLSHIARRYGTSVRALMDANRIGRRSIIRPGQMLTVPVPRGSSRRRSRHTASRARLAAAAAGHRRTYVVRKGDTLSEIAEAHAVSLSALRRWNGLGRRSRIYPGQRLVVGPPADEPGGRRLVYRVRRGDTLSEIARRFSVSVEDLRRWNHLPHDRILAGDSLEIFTSSP